MAPKKNTRKPSNEKQKQIMKLSKKIKNESKRNKNNENQERYKKMIQYSFNVSSEKRIPLQSELAKSACAFFGVQVGIGCFIINRWRTCVCSAVVLSVLKVSQLRENKDARYDRIINSGLAHPLPFMLKDVEWELGKTTIKCNLPLKTSDFKEVYDEYVKEESKNGEWIGQIINGVCLWKKWETIRQQLKDYADIMNAAIKHSPKVLSKVSYETLHTMIDRRYEFVVERFKVDSEYKRNFHNKLTKELIQSVIEEAIDVEEERIVQEEDKVLEKKAQASKSQLPSASKKRRPKRKVCTKNQQKSPNGKDENKSLFLNMPEFDESERSFDNNLYPIQLGDGITDRHARAIKRQKLLSEEKQRKAEVALRVSKTSKRHKEAGEVLRKKMETNEAKVAAYVLSIPEGGSKDDPYQAHLQWRDWKKISDTHQLQGEDFFSLPNDTYQRSVDGKLCFLIFKFQDCAGRDCKGPDNLSFKCPMISTKDGLVEPSELKKVEFVKEKLKLLLTQPDYKLKEIVRVPLSPTYIGFFKKLHICLHATTLVVEFKRLETANEELGDPITITKLSAISTNCCTDDLKEPDAVIIHKNDDEWNKSLHLKHLPFRHSFFKGMIERYDEKNKENRDIYRNGFLLNAGFSGGTHHTPTDMSQALNENIVTSMPGMIGQKEIDLLENMGPVFSAFSNVVRNYIQTTDGTMSMNDPILEEVFGSGFGHLLGCPSGHPLLKCLFPAMSFGVSKVGTLVDENGAFLPSEFKLTYDFLLKSAKIKVNFDGQSYHVDGLNMNDVSGFNHTGVFQSMFVLKHDVYRVFAIAYTRQSTYLWSKCNYGIIPPVNELLDKVMEDIGTLYEGINLSDNLTDIYIEELTVNDQHRSRIVGPSQKGQPNVLQAQWRSPEYNDRVVMQNETKVNKLFNPDARILLQGWIKILTVTEGDNRAADYSSKAWAANRLKHRYGLTERNAIELHWAAIMTVSPITYTSVLEYWYRGRRIPICSHGRSKTTFQWNDDNVMLLYEFYLTAVWMGLDVFGGEYSRMTGQAARNWPVFYDAMKNKCSGAVITPDDVCTKETYETYLNIIRTEYKRLERGDIQRNKDTGRPKYEVPGVGDINCISFAPLAIFMNIVSHNILALAEATDAGLNKKHVDTCWEYLVNEGHIDELSIPKPNAEQFRRIFSAIARKRGWLQWVIEQLLCRKFRHKKWIKDVFFQGQHVYDIKGKKVLVKLFGTTQWKNVIDVSLNELYGEPLTKKL